MAKILFIRGGAVGDFILTLPAIKLVRDNLPDCEIEILGYPGIAELAVVSGLADSVRSIEHAALALFFSPKSELDEEMCDYLSSFDVVVSYLFDPDQIFQNNLIRAGVETLFCGPFRMDESEPRQHAAYQLAKPLESLALYLDEPWVELTYGNTETDSGSGNKPEILVHPGSGSPSKNWSFESWIDVLTVLRKKHPDITFTIISGEAEHEVIGDFLALLSETGSPYRHLESLPLSRLAVELAGADFFLGHDSGISHLAASTGIPGLTLFGPTRPEIWAPPHPRFNVLQSPKNDLAGIRPEMVLERIEQSGF